MTRKALIANHPESAAFWDAAGEGRLLIPQCLSCGRRHWHPRPFCPFCFSSEVAWRPSDGHGALYAYSINPTTTPPSVVAYVVLDDGPTLLANIFEAAPEALSIGRRVRVVFPPVSSDELPSPAFTLI